MEHLSRAGVGPDFLRSFGMLDRVDRVDRFADHGFGKAGDPKVVPGIARLLYILLVTNLVLDQRQRNPDGGHRADGLDLGRPLVRAEALLGAGEDQNANREACDPERHQVRVGKKLLEGFRPYRYNRLFR